MPDEALPDARMMQIETKLSTMGQQLQQMDAYLAHVPDDEREAARAAVRIGVEVGVVLEQLKHVPLHPPLSVDGTLQLGSGLRQHLLKVRDVYGKIDDLRDQVSGLLNADASDLTHPIPRDPRTVRTDTSAGEYTMAI